MISKIETDAKVRVRTWLKILKTSNFIEKYLRERLRNDHHTTLPRFDVMSALQRSSNGLKMSELSGVLKVSNGNITGIIDRLVQEGHVERIAIKGRQASISCITNR
jgi:DNA-binding MarR family transcriptional regulator